MAIVLQTIEEYKSAVKSGFQPLFGVEYGLPIKLRVDIQRQTFGKSETSKGDVLKGNERFYKWVWDNKPHVCEETGKPLGDEFSATYISHILSRGAHPEMAHDPRNVNLLSPEAHEQWENGDRKKMNIFASNEIRIEALKNEYATLKKSKDDEE